jgi:hypothetical protein
MPLFDCSVGDSLHFGDEIRIQLTGRVDGLLYVFVDAKRCHALAGGNGFRASALCGEGHRAHVLALGDGDGFSIGPVRVEVAQVRIELPVVQVLRDVRLRIEAPMPCVLSRPERPKHRPHRRAEKASCRS